MLHVNLSRMSVYIILDIDLSYLGFLSLTYVIYKNKMYVNKIKIKSVYTLLIIR